MASVDEALNNLNAARLAHAASADELDLAKQLCASCGGEDDEMGEKPSHTNVTAPERFGLKHREHGAQVEAAYQKFQATSQALVEAEEQVTLATLQAKYGTA